MGFVLQILQLHKERSFYNSPSLSVTIITTDESQSQPFQLAVKETSRSQPAEF